MPPVYVTAQGATLKRSGQRLLVVQERTVLADVPVFGLDRVLLFGNGTVTAPAAALLLEAGVEVAYLSRRGKLRGVLRAMEGGNIFVRLAHYQRWRETEWRLAFVRRVVETKVLNQRAVVLAHHRNHPDDDLVKVMAELQEAAARAREGTDIDQLRGFEGNGSASYFRGFRKMVRGEMTFEHRRRHPPPDPVNALLSLGYVLVTNELVSLIQASSLEGMLGFFHGVRYGRQSLALDIVEEFRAPLVDRLVLRLVNLRMLKPDDFEPAAGGGLHLTAEAAKGFFSQYESLMTAPPHADAGGRPARGAMVATSVREEGPTWRELLRRQVERLVHAIVQGGEYEPFDGTRPEVERPGARRTGDGRSSQGGGARREMTTESLPGETAGELELSWEEELSWAGLSGEAETEPLSPRDAAEFDGEVAQPLEREE